MQFHIGQRVKGYNEEGEPVKGRISAFSPPDKARVYCETGVYTTVLLDTCHPLPLGKATHTKETFLAAASRVSPCLAFKGQKEQRDYLERLWQELEYFSQEDSKKKPNKVRAKMMASISEMPKP